MTFAGLNINVIVDMTRRASNCFLQSIADPTVQIPLPHNKLVAIGRSHITKIKDTLVSRKQIILKANYNDRDVKATAVGVNYASYNGFILHKHRSYHLKHGGRLELLLGNYSYDLFFEPDESENETLELLPKEPKLYFPIFDYQSQPSCSNSKNVSEITGKWEMINRAMLLFTPNANLSRPNVASFDLDGTLIKTKSGHRFPRDEFDWTETFANVKRKLTELFTKNYRLVLFTNQSKLGQEKHLIPLFKEKIETIVKHFNVPMQVFIALNKDVYRKPSPGMWNMLEELMGDVNLSDSFYVGDAAGRDKNWAPHKHKDHSLADRLFAANVGLKFYTPEEYFLGTNSVPYNMPEFDPSVVVKFEQQIELQTYQEVILMVGSPASGKSFFCKQNLIPYGYVHINRDLLGSKQRCLKVMEDSLQESKSVVIDNTNPDVESRKFYIDIARRYNIPCRCFLMDIPIKHSKHNNKFRLITDKNHIPVSDIIINTYYKNYQEPSVNEGFIEVTKLKFNPMFDNPDHKTLYRMYLLES